MNWIDGILVALLLAMVIIGSKKGMIRELAAFVVFFAALILSVRYIDGFAVWMHNQIGGSALTTAILSFIVLLAACYLLFKLLGMAFYKIASVKESKRRDYMGGALLGFLRGWVAVSFLLLLTFFVPMPDWFYTSFEQSMIGPTMAKTIPLMYESTAVIHHGQPRFMDQIESVLLKPTTDDGGEGMTEDRTEVYRVIYQMDRFFRVSKS